MRSYILATRLNGTVASLFGVHLSFSIFPFSHNHNIHPTNYILCVPNPSFDHHSHFSQWKTTFSSPSTKNYKEILPGIIQQQPFVFPTRKAKTTTMPSTMLQTSRRRERINIMYHRRNHMSLDAPVLTTIPEEQSFGDSVLNASCCHHDFEDAVVNLVTLERRCRNLPLFERNVELDRMALQQARRMAKSMFVHHSVGNVRALQNKLNSEFVGENIQRGDSVHGMHCDTMYTKSINRDNILSDYFDQIGSGVAWGADGKMYSCQLFRSKSS